MAERQRATTVARPKTPKAPKQPKAMSAAQRNALATKMLLDHLAASDKAIMITAALELVNEQITLDTAFKRCLQQKYQELEALSLNTRKKDIGPVPVPIRTRETGSYSPYSRYDPYQLLYEYGHDQLRAVLLYATQARLREAVGVVHEREPDAKLPNRSSNDAMIDYIMQHVAGPGY